VPAISKSIRRILVDPKPMDISMLLPYPINSDPNNCRTGVPVIYEDGRSSRDQQSPTLKLTRQARPCRVTRAHHTADDRRTPHEGPVHAPCNARLMLLLLLALHIHPVGLLARSACSDSPVPP
jgi:hypothetical protein